MKTTSHSRFSLKSIFAVFLLFGVPNLLSAQLTVSIIPTQITCFGAANGHAEAILTGGTPPYSYTWSNGETTQAIQSLAPGTYSVTVLDASPNTATATTTISQPTQLGLTVGGQSQLCDIAPDGLAYAVPNGGTAPYTYNWSNGETTIQINNLTEGLYTATVTDALGCTASSSFTVGFWNEGIFTSATTMNTNCGFEQGAITLEYISGVPPYQFQWSNGATTQDLMNLAAGTYSLTVSDANGCVGYKNWNIHTVYGPPQIVVLPQPYCILQTAQFAHEVSDVFPYIFWQINNPLDQIIWGQGTDSIAVQWSGFGAKTVKMEFGVNNLVCGVIEYQLNVTLCVAATEPELEGLQVSPNPFSDYLQLVFSGEFPGEAEASLSDLSGKTLSQTKLHGSSTKIPTTDLLPGMYFLEVKSGNAQKVMKVLKILK